MKPKKNKRTKQEVIEKEKIAFEAHSYNGAAFGKVYWAGKSREFVFRPVSDVEFTLPELKLVMDHMLSLRVRTV